MTDEERKKSIIGTKISLEFDENESAVIQMNGDVAGMLILLSEALRVVATRMGSSRESVALALMHIGKIADKNRTQLIRVDPNLYRKMKEKHRNEG